MRGSQGTIVILLVAIGFYFVGQGTAKQEEPRRLITSAQHEVQKQYEILNSEYNSKLLVAIEQLTDTGLDETIREGIKLHNDFQTLTSLSEEQSMPIEFYKNFMALGFMIEQQLMRAYAEYATRCSASIGAGKQTPNAVFGRNTKEQLEVNSLPGT